MDNQFLNAIMARKTLTQADLLGTKSGAARLAGSQAAQSIGEFVQALDLSKLRASEGVMAEAQVIGEAATEALTRITAARTTNKEIKVVLDLAEVYDEDSDVLNIDQAGVLEVAGLKAGTQSPYNPLTIRSVQAVFAAIAVVPSMGAATATQAVHAILDCITRTQLRLKVSGSDDLVIPIGAMACGTVMGEVEAGVATNAVPIIVQVPESIAHAVQGLDLVSGEDALTATLNDPRKVGALGVCTAYNVQGGAPGDVCEMYGTITFIFNCEAL